MDSDILREDVGQETEKTLAAMNIGQFAILLDDVSVIESLIPVGDKALTLEALFNLVYHEAGNRSIDGYEAYTHKDQQAVDISSGERAAKTLHENGLAFNMSGNVVPIFPPNADKTK